MHPTKFSQAVLDWYDHQGRKDLPWRENITPYRVWISEIMLQQTQVKTVIPYFRRFMESFPTLQDLAQADEDAVLHLWTGLGYYARARNMHRAAKLVIEHHAGELPDSLEGLQLLPGIGRSTAGAILAIAMNKRAAILDGNVKRILTRYNALPGVSTKAAVAASLWRYAEKYTPSVRVGDYTQAIMDLGATLCTRSRPTCLECPIARKCRAYKLNKLSAFPELKANKKLPVRSVQMLIFYDRQTNAVLLEKRPATGVWGGLWSFPECRLNIDLEQWCWEKYNFSPGKHQELTSIKHVFTHFQLNITPLLITGNQCAWRVMDSSRHVWYKLGSIVALGFSSPIKRLLDQLEHLER